MAGWRVVSVPLDAEAQPGVLGTSTMQGRHSGRGPLAEPPAETPGRLRPGALCTVTYTPVTIGCQACDSAEIKAVNKP